MADFLATLSLTHVSIIREWQKETWDGERWRYWSVKYMLTKRLVDALKAVGIGLDYEYVAPPSMMWARDAVEPTKSGTMPRFSIEPGLMRLVAEYQDRCDLSSRSNTIFNLLGLPPALNFTSQGSKVRERRHVHIKGEALAKIIRWRQEVKATSGMSLSLASILGVQLLDGLERLGLKMSSTRSATLIGRIRGGRPITDIENRTHSYDYRVPEPLYALLLRAAPQLGLSGVSRYTACEAITMLILQAESLHSTLLQASFPYGQEVEALRKVRAKHDKAAAEKVYVERFLQLCKERAARDKWHRKGGVGKPPPSTVDDHLGRTVHGPDANRIAADRVSRHADMREHRQDVARRAVR